MTAPPPPTVTAVAVPGLPEIGAGDDLAAAVVAACGRAGLRLGGTDVVVVASKVVAKAEGRSLAAADRSRAVDEQTVRVVAERLLPDGRLTRVVQSRSGPVLAAAGVDASDVPEGTVLLLPADPDASARTLRARLRELTGLSPAVLVSDTAGRPWRQGVTDFALGAAGLRCLDDVRGTSDRFGRPLEVTVRAVADQAAALADLVKGKGAGLPVALVRGLGAYVGPDDGPGAGGCVRTGPGDWFAHGQVEAVRASLGLADGEVAPPPVDPATEDDAARTARARAVALAGDAPAGVRLEPVPGGTAVHGDPVAAGVVAQRLVSALWAEGLAGSVRVTDRTVVVDTVVVDTVVVDTQVANSAG